MLLDYARKYYDYPKFRNGEEDADEIPEPSEPEKKEALRAFGLFGQRNYWRRAWIRQEVILAKEVTIYCGSRALDGWNIFLMGWLCYMEGDIWDSKIIDLYPLEPLIVRYGRSECGELRGRVFSLLSLASDCDGREITIANYDLDAPALFFALMNLVKPANITEFTSILQEILEIRTCQLLRYTEWVTTSSEPVKAKSPMDEMAATFVSSVKNLLVSPAFGVSEGSSNHFTQTETSADWYTQCRPYAESTINDDKKPLFEIQNTSFTILANPTLIGLQFVRVYRKVESDVESVPEGESRWQVYEHPFQLDLDKLGILIKYFFKDVLDPDKRLSLEERESFQEESTMRVLLRGLGPDFANPSIELILGILLVLHLASDNGICYYCFVRLQDCVSPMVVGSLGWVTREGRLGIQCWKEAATYRASENLDGGQSLGHCLRTSFLACFLLFIMASGPRELTHSYTSFYNIQKHTMDP
ncbi:hypothetical protein GQ44DRAFT_727062 [Phaeosphaeriaceae sp. PMI808]|nr:hypothetical protein GQ44DRAFT_727062 [Phaeosphaeriaceae sp. PMI808]